MATIKKTSKRVQLDRDKTITIIAISVAVVALVAALVVGKGLWDRASYLRKVASKREAAVSQLKSNQVAFTELSNSYKVLVEQDPNLLGGSRGGTGDRDGSNDALILDALPSKYDFPALTASLEKILAGYRIRGISGVDDSLALGGSGGGSGLGEIPFSLDVDTSYTDLKLLIDSFNRSIRPFQLLRLELRGSNSSLNVSINAKTFYQSEKGLEIKEEQVP